MWIFLNEQHIEQARSVNLLEYLHQYESENIKHMGGNHYQLRDHDSLKITAPDGKWFWFSRGFGGHTALDYLIKVRDIPFGEAVSTLCGKDMRPDDSLNLKAVKPQEKNPFILPKAAKYPQQVIRYLQDRGIHPDLIRYALDNKLIYQSKRHKNLVFIGYDEKKQARFAAERGTVGNFKADVSGSDKTYSFHIPSSDPDCKTLAVFESPIDALSHATLQHMKNISWDGYRLSLGGTSEKALVAFLDRHPQINNILLCLDSDEPGRIASEKLQTLLGKNPKYEVKSYPPSFGKDYNENLQIRLKNERQKVAPVNHSSR